MTTVWSARARVRGLLIWPLVAACLPAAVFAAETVEEDWMIVRIAGQRAGQAHMTVRRDGGRITSEIRQQMTIERMGVAITQEVTQESTETVDGELVSFTQQQKVAAQTVVVEGRREGDSLVLTSTTMGATRSRTVPWPKDATFGYAMERYVRAHMGGPGTRFHYTTFSIELDRFLEVTYEVVGEEEIDVLGRRVRAYRSLVHGLYPGIVPVEYRDADGITWKAELGMMGIDIELLRAPKEVAERRTAGPARFDALADLSVDPGRRIPRPREVDSARYRLTLRKGRATDLSLAGPGQRVASSSPDGAVVIEVTSIRPEPERVLPHPIREPAFESFLSASTYLQSDDEEVRRVAHEVAGQVRSAYAAAKRLELWVFRNITTKNFDRGFATAKEVLRDRVGDCTEHSVLLCALLRAAGIPARVAAGLMYVELPSGKPIFGYHMWVEAYVGQWVPLDAILAGRFVDATHIRLSGSDLAGMSPAGGLLDVLQVLGQLEIEVLECSIGGRPKTGPGRPGTVETRYHDLIYEFSLAAPAGWTLLTQGDPELEESEVCRCSLPGGAERVSVLTASVPPGMTLSEVLDKAYDQADVRTRVEASLGGAAAVRMAYTKPDGTSREAVTTVRAGTVYVIRLEPPTERGRKALDEMVTSFRFD